MNGYDYAFWTALVLLFATEFTALAKDHSNTYTSKLVGWMKEKRTARRRIMVGVFTFWLFYHFTFQYF